MSEASQHLLKIKNFFEEHAIISEAQIVENVSFLLSLYGQWDDISDEMLAHPRELQQIIYNAEAELLKTYSNLSIPATFPIERLDLDGFIATKNFLNAAIDNSPYNVEDHEIDLGAFFQREVRSELLKSTSGSQYPTPYHIAEFMAALGFSHGEGEISILDPAMGTAGLLVAALHFAPEAMLTGADFDPIWAGIGSANLILHDKGDSEVYVGSAFEKHGEWQEQFNTVLLNPPFGGSRGKGDVAQTVGEEYGRNNATVFGALALQALQPHGRAAFLTPSGTLFANRGAEANLKEALLAEKLETIITLPNRSFYPHSNIKAHLIVVQKRGEDGDPATNPIWFCEVEQDGYPEGSERDLTIPPDSEDNELPRVRELILHNRNLDSWETQLELDEIGPIQTAMLQPDDGLPGMGVRVGEGYPLPKWNLSSSSTGHLIKILNQEDELKGWIAQSYDDGSLIAVTQEQGTACNWTDIFGSVDWEDGLHAEWENEQVESRLQIQTEDQPGFELTQQRTTYQFSGEGEHDELACLLDETGDQQTPWLTIQDPKKIREQDFGDRFAAIPLQNINEVQVGWLINWTEFSENKNEDVEEGYEPSVSQMLVVFQNQVDLFEQADSLYGFIPNAYFQVDPTNSRFSIERGWPIHLKDEAALAGFALGPASWRQHGFRMFGALIHREDFSPEDDLQPSRFLPEPEQPAIEHPATVIAKIRKNQTEIDVRVGALLSMLGSVPQYEENSNQAFTIPTWLTETLDNQQKSLYSLIKDKHLEDGRPVHFNSKDVLNWKEEGEDEITYSDADITMQLELFNRMGLVVKIHSEKGNLFRCLTYGDVIEQQTETPEEENEAD